jgi:acetyl-CoA carboxylase beta subunit
MPWKRCPDCHECSYSADESRDSWCCPTCGRELILEPDTAGPKLPDGPPAPGQLWYGSPDS